MHASWKLLTHLLSESASCRHAVLAAHVDENEDTDDGEQCTRPLSHGPPPDGWTSDDCDDYVDQPSGLDAPSALALLQPSRRQGR